MSSEFPEDSEVLAEIRAPLGWSPPALGVVVLCFPLVAGAVYLSLQGRAILLSWGGEEFLVPLLWPLAVGLGLLELYRWAAGRSRRCLVTAGRVVVVGGVFGRRVVAEAPRAPGAALSLEGSRWRYSPRDGRAISLPDLEAGGVEGLGQALGLDVARLATERGSLALARRRRRAVACFGVCVAITLLGEGLRQLESASLATYKDRVSRAREAISQAQRETEVEAKELARARASRRPLAKRTKALEMAECVIWEDFGGVLSPLLWRSYMSGEDNEWRKKDLGFQMPSLETSLTWRARVEVSCVRPWRVLPRDPGPVLIRPLGYPDDEILVSALERRLQELGVPYEIRSLATN